MACDHQPHTDPRFASTCLKCGKALPGPDPAYERLFLTEAVALAAKNLAADSDQFVVNVLRRLEFGQKTYKNLSYARPIEYLGKMMREECWDVGAWGAIAAVVLQRLQPGDVDEALWHLQQMVVLGAAADWHGRRFLDAVSA